MREETHHHRSDSERFTRYAEAFIRALLALPRQKLNFFDHFLVVAGDICAGRFAIIGAALRALPTSFDGIGANFIQLNPYYLY